MNAGPSSRGLLCIAPCFFVFLMTLQLATAQIGTMNQDITTIAAFGIQKACARDCFVNTGFCPNDIIGTKIGCVEHTDCNDQNWQATNDCYCRSDLQNPAHDFLTSCVLRSCQVGDSRIDASTAGSIYAQYCAQKGYALASPSPVQATTTKAGAGAASKATNPASGPTDSSNPDTSPPPSSSSNKLSTGAIIGIAVGGLAGLIILSWILKWVFQRFPDKTETLPPRYPPHYPPQYPSQPPSSFPNPPVFPREPFEPSYYPPHINRDAELRPEDSASMISSAPPLAPTLVGGSGYPRRYA